MTHVFITLPDARIILLSCFQPQLSILTSNFENHGELHVYLEQCSARGTDPRKRIHAHRLLGHVVTALLLFSFIQSTNRYRCPPCKAIAPFFEELAKENATDKKLAFVKVKFTLLRTILTNCQG